MGGGVEAERVDAAREADGGQDIGQLAPRAVVHERAGGGDRGDAEPLGQAGAPGEALRVLPVIGRGQREMAGAGEAARHPQRAFHPIARAALHRRRGFRRLLRVGRGRGVDQEREALAPVEQVLDRQVAVALGRPGTAQRQQAAEPPPGGAVARQGGDLDPLLQHQPGRGDQPQHRAAVAGDLLGAGMGAHDAGHGILVGDGQGGQPEVEGARDIVLGVRGPAEEGEVGDGAEFDEGHGGGVNGNNTGT